MTADIIPMPEPLEKIGARIDAAYTRTQHGRDEWTEGSLELAALLTEARARFPSDNAFGAWLGEGYHDHLGKNDRAALINFGANLKAARICFQETTRFSYRLLWDDVKSWFPSGGKPAPEPKSIPEPPAAAVVEPEIAKPMAPEPEKSKAGIEQPSVMLYDAPEKSKLRDVLKPAIAEVLLTRFKNTRMFVLLCTANPKKECVTLLNYLAERCQHPDYPIELFQTASWTLRLLYPHLPQRLLDMTARSSIRLLAKTQHASLAETERRFIQTPEFGVTDPPLVAFNKAQAIYQSIVHAKNGGTIDPTAHHKPTYASDEGKPPVIIRGTQVWPAEEGEGYCYNDLRCACGFASDVVKTFDDTRGAPMSTRSLKLRHLMSWIDGGYNAKGSTTAGMLKALRSVIQAYSSDKSEIMQNPLPNMVKNDE